MKNLISFITLLIFLHTITYHMISTEAKDELHDPVLDEDGNNLRSDEIYYVLPTVIGTGGLISRRLGDKKCRFGVSQALEGDGLPVQFYQLNSPLGGAIRESTDTNIIMFPAQIGCNSSGVWKVDVNYEPSGQNFIVTDGVAEIGSTNIWFWIEKAEGKGNNYNFRYCPPNEYCFKCPPICTDIDFVDNGAEMGFLALAKTSYSFKFRRFERQAERY